MFNTDYVNISQKPVDTIDFRKQGWGHAIHSSTFSVVRRGDGLVERIRSFFDKITRTRRYSVLVHSYHCPVVGQTIIWESVHGDIRAKLYDFDCFPNVRDMFKLYVKVKR